MPATTPTKATEQPADRIPPNWALYAAIEIIKRVSDAPAPDELAWLIANRLETARLDGVAAGLDMAARAADRGQFR